jgi:hypothetical protein
MADAYGGITLATSEDSEINAKQLVKLLNRFNWTNANGEWITNKMDGRDAFWHFDDFNTQYPSLFPREFVTVIRENDDGTVERIPYEEATEEDLDQAWDMEEKDIPLEELSKHFKKALKKGWFEIACTANEKNRYVYFHSLRIYADGKAERKQIETGCCVRKPLDETEIFEPS